jgi:hypothetical protein
MSVHGEPAKEPVLLLVKLAVPVGVDAPINAVSRTVTVQVVAWFRATDEGEQVTDAAVESLPKLIDVDP